MSDSTKKFFISFPPRIVVVNGKKCQVYTNYENEIEYVEIAEAESSDEKIQLEFDF